MMMSAPSAFCTSMLRCGVRRTIDPSTWLLNVTPASVMRLMSESEKT